MEKKKAVAYCRVSTRSDAQIHSFMYQNEYWRQAIEKNEDYEFAGIYADEGISGRSVVKRTRQLQMLEDARRGYFDVIFTKSVARFARNTEELLKMVRELRDLGVKVIFEKERIETFNPNSELYLTIAASVAENELKTFGENQGWSIRNRYKHGWVSIGSQIFGYTMNSETNTLEVQPEQAEVVKRIYELYLAGNGLAKVCRILEAEGRQNIKGKAKWSIATVRYILSNEKYKGCSLAQKRYKIGGTFKRNKGELPQYYMEDTHEAIIAPEVFDEVQRVMDQRTTKNIKGVEKPVYGLKGTIQCGLCGHGYGHKIQNVGLPWSTEIWVCSHQNIHGQAGCTNNRIKDEVLKAKFVECFNEFITTNPEVEAVKELRKALAHEIDLEHELTALKVNRLIDIKDYEREVALVRKSIEAISRRIAEMQLRDIRKCDCYPRKKFTEGLYHKFIDKVIIHPGKITFRFVNGVEITKDFDNGPAGNQKGWLEKKNKRQKAKTTEEA